MILKRREIREKIMKYKEENKKNNKRKIKENLFFSFHITDISYRFMLVIYSHIYKIMSMSLYMDLDAFIPSSDSKSGA